MTKVNYLSCRKHHRQQMTIYPGAIKVLKELRHGEDENTDENVDEVESGQGHHQAVKVALSLSLSFFSENVDSGGVAQKTENSGDHEKDPF